MNSIRLSYLAMIVGMAGLIAMLFFGCGDGSEPVYNPVPRDQRVLNMRPVTQTELLETLGPPCTVTTDVEDRVIYIYKGKLVEETTGSHVRHYEVQPRDCEPPTEEEKHTDKQIRYIFNQGEDRISDVQIAHPQADVP